jgi:hypothetical protein
MAEHSVGRIASISDVVEDGLSGCYMHRQIESEMLQVKTAQPFLAAEATRTIEIDPVGSPMVIHLMGAYATGAHILSTLRKMLNTELARR